MIAIDIQISTIAVQFIFISSTCMHAYIRIWIHAFVLSIFSISFLLSSSAYALTAFTDSLGHEYGSSIEFLHARWIVKWYPGGNFGADQPINRSEIMKIILEAASTGMVFQNMEEPSMLPKTSASGKWTAYQLQSGTNCFRDVQQQRFSSYVCYAKENNIVKGYPDGTFKPWQYVTIAEALKITLEAFNVPVEEDRHNADSWYQPYLDFVHNNTIFSKYSLRPDAYMTRWQMAYLAHQLMLEKEWKRQFTGIRQVASLGCWTTPPASAPTSSYINGQMRNYITVIGNKYDENTPTKLIFAFHGRTNPNTMVRNYYRIERAAAWNAIIIYPSGLPEQWPSRNRSSPGDKSSQLRDFALFDQLVKEFSNNYCINTDQIFVMGHSLGAWFTNSLSCARGDVIRAIGSVGGGTTINDCSGPVAAMIMHHPDDNLASFPSGIIARDQMLAQNSCGPETIPTGPSDWNCVEYINCQEWAPVIRCPHSDSLEWRDGAYYPHTWPDFAGQEIRNFFNRQS